MSKPNILQIIAVGFFTVASTCSLYAQSHALKSLDLSMGELEIATELEQLGAQFHAFDGKARVTFDRYWGKKFDQLVGYLKSLPVNSVTIYGDAEISSDQVVAIAESDQISSLKLFNLKEDETILATLPKLNHLSSLSIQSDGISPEFIQSLTSLDRLERLSLFDGVSRSRCLMPTTINEIAKLEKLEILSLFGASLNEQSCDAICSLSRLTALSLVDCELPNDAFANSDQLTELNTLLLNLCSVDFETATNLGKLPHIQELHLFETDIDDEKFAEIFSCLRPSSGKDILSLNLSGSKITARTIDLLIEKELGFSMAHVVLPDDLDDSSLKQRKPDWRIEKAKRSIYKAIVTWEDK